MINNSVCCVIVTYNIGERFYNCFNAIYNQVEKVVIVDNGSTEETLKILHEISNNTTAEVIYNEENIGIASALNKGIEFGLQQKYNWILTMDHDSKATRNMINVMLECYEKISCEDKNKIGSLFPVHIEPARLDKSDIIESRSELGFKYTNYDIASGNLIKTEVFRKISLFDEKMFIDLVDTEFSLRLSENNIKMIQVLGAKLIHTLGDYKEIKTPFGKFTVSNHSPIRRYYITRNRLYVWNRYGNGNNPLIEDDKKANLKEIVKLFLVESNKFEKMKMIFKAHKDYKKGIMGKIRE
ncbi:glycosyltransferase [Clostridium sp. YIM B02506]|uniref:glycosyltransferase n=1 Tax=Clostridium sp. YIM B02506 TaxID=2910680 RepID=UPI001EEE860E|nr:glycosyltransferase [Clostridium sp. YIM B02506]